MDRFVRSTIIISKSLSDVLSCFPFLFTRPLLLLETIVFFSTAEFFPYSRLKTLLYTLLYILYIFTYRQTETVGPGRFLLPYERIPFCFSSLHFSFTPFSPKAFCRPALPFALTLMVPLSSSSSSKLFIIIFITVRAGKGMAGRACCLGLGYGCTLLASSWVLLCYIFYFPRWSVWVGPGSWVWVRRDWVDIRGHKGIIVF